MCAPFMTTPAAAAAAAVLLLLFAVAQQAEIGVDAGAYARLLMVHAKEAADAAADEVAAGTLSAQYILESAFYRTNVQGVSGGSRSTCAALEQLSRLPLLAHELTRQGVSLWGASYLLRRPLQWWCYPWY